MVTRLPYPVCVASELSYSSPKRFSSHLNYLIFEFQMAFEMFFAKALNISYSVIIADDGIGVQLEDGNWTGVIGLLQRGECDLSLDFIEVTEERATAVDFSTPYYISRITFLAQKPKPLPKHFAIIFYPFSKILWIIYILFILGSSLLFAKMYFGKRKFVRSLLLTVGNVFGQPFTIEIKSSTMMLLFGSWILGNSVLVYSYRATLLSFLIITPQKGINTIPELSAAVRDGSVTCVTLQGSYLIKAFLESNDSSLRIIGKSLRENSPNFVPGHKFTLDGSENVAFIGAEFFHRYERFKFLLSEDSFFPVFFSVLMRKNFCCREVLDKTIRRVVEAGLYHKMLEEVEAMFVGVRLRYNYAKAEEIHQLSIEDIQGAVLILICGNILSFLVLIVEYLFNKIRVNSE